MAAVAVEWPCTSDLQCRKTNAAEDEMGAECVYLFMINMPRLGLVWKQGCAHTCARVRSQELTNNAAFLQGAREDDVHVLSWLQSELHLAQCVIACKPLRRGKGALCE